jgi:hypothetical protein
MRRTELENLIQVKADLADKYERLAADRSSKPRKTRLIRRAEAYRQQFLNLAEKLRGQRESSKS